MRYVYKKYNTKTMWSNETTVITYNGKMGDSRSSVTLYQGFAYSDSGGYSLNSPKTGTYDSLRGNKTYYTGVSNLTNKRSVKKIFLGINSGGYAISPYITSDISRITITGKGNFLNDIIAEENSYPNNGKQGDYWYEKSIKVQPIILTDTTSYKDMTITNIKNVKYTISHVDVGTLNTKISVYLNDILNYDITENITNNSIYNLNIAKSDFSVLKDGSLNVIRIVATDGESSVETNITFTKISITKFLLKNSVDVRNATNMICAYPPTENDFLTNGMDNITPFYAQEVNPKINELLDGGEVLGIGVVHKYHVKKSDMLSITGFTVG